MYYYNIKNLLLNEKVKDYILSIKNNTVNLIKNTIFEYSSNKEFYEVDYSIRYKNIYDVPSTYKFNISLLPIIEAVSEKISNSKIWLEFDYNRNIYPAIFYSMSEIPQFNRKILLANILRNGHYCMNNISFLSILENNNSFIESFSLMKYRPAAPLRLVCSADKSNIFNIIRSIDSINLVSEEILNLLKELDNSLFSIRIAFDLKENIDRLDIEIFDNFSTSNTTGKNLLKFIDIFFNKSMVSYFDIWPHSYCIDNILFTNRISHVKIINTINNKPYMKVYLASGIEERR